MTNTTIPCRAKDPRTCPYHSAEIRATAALAAGMLDDYLTAQQDMVNAAKTSDEVTDFFAHQVSDPAKPFATSAQIAAVLAKEFKAIPKAERPALATRIQSILLETGTSRAHRYHQFGAIRRVLEERLIDEDVKVSDIAKATRKIFQTNGWLTTRKGEHGLYIYDTRDTRIVQTTGSDIRPGAVITTPKGDDFAEVIAFKNADGTQTTEPGPNTINMVLHNQFTNTDNKVILGYGRGEIYPWSADGSYGTLTEAA